MLKILIISLLPFAKLFAQPGAADEALAAQVALSRGEWALWRNPAGLCHTNASAVSSGVQQLPAIKLLSKSALVAINTHAGTFAAGAIAFGDDLYREQTLSLGYAHSIGITNIGIRADALELRIHDFGLRRTFGVTIGASTAIGKRITIGAVARNINLPKWIDGEPLPVVLNTGLRFIPSDNFLLVAELEKNTDFDPTFKSAFEYSLHKKFFIRTGFNLHPHAAFGGFGLQLWRLGFDYSLRWSYLPGYAQQVSISIKSAKNIKSNDGVY
ncbi:MAG TPA: hypothetical protein VFE50_25690 [Cyclobacteriaceae bacterium]|nr:hypothetical protein [Cyclobacteriaceae bacterium]